MGDLIQIEFDPQKRMANACEDPILQAFHELHITGDVTTDDEVIADNIDRYTEEGMISELMGWYNLNAGQARTVFGMVQLSIQDNNVE